MAGHSKWANIKHRKAAADSKKGKVFTRLIKEITVAAKAGGGDPAMNPRLRLSLEKAREANMTNDSVRRAIQRGTGELEGTSYDEVRYEGYGPGGAAVLLDCLTDNRTRTVAEVRHAFVKNGGNLGSDGSVAYLFKHCGQFIFAPGTSEDAVMEAALDAGAEDVRTDGDIFLVVTEAGKMVDVREALEKKNMKPSHSEVGMYPDNSVRLEGDEAAAMMRLITHLEDHDDVQNVYVNADIDEELYEKLSA
jgi:YebC/PmpR family DNA-binding regulatory protein